MINIEFRKCTSPHHFGGLGLGLGLEFGHENEDLIMPAEKHDDTSPDDVKPGPLLSEGTTNSSVG